MIRAGARDPSPVAREIIWRRPERAAKGPAPSSSRRRVTEAAVRLADAEGIEAVSMRRLAAELGVGAASLYRYVDTKDELLDLMIDFVEGEDEDLPALCGEWRVDLTAIALRTRQMYWRHPWLTSATASRPSFGPNSLRWTEHGLAALDPLRLDADARLSAGEALTAFTRGFVVRELAEASAQRDRRDPDSWGSRIAPYLDEVIAGGAHPRFAAVVRQARLPHEATRDALFLAALSWILDGLAAGGLPGTTG